MKKLMMAVAIVCAAVCAQAATANWKVSAANIFNGTGSTDASAKFSGTAYFFDATAKTQEALFEDFAANTGMNFAAATGYLASGTVASGVINANTAANQFSKFDQGSGTHDFYIAIVNGDNIYLSDTKSVAAGSTDSAVTITFGSQNATTLPKSSAAALEGYQGTGLWSVAPEPTSGLLMLIGMGALALRRRRA